MKRIAFMLIALALTSCANMPLTTMAMESDSYNYRAPVDTDDKEVTIKVVWVPIENMHVFCGKGHNACAKPIGDNRWILYSEKPNSWNDSAKLRRLGHEVLHALGGLHEVVQ